MSFLNDCLKMAMQCIMALQRESSHSRYLQLVSQLVTPDSLNSQGGGVDSLWRHYLMRYSLSFLSWVVFSLCLPSAMIDLISLSPVEEVQQEIKELHSNSPKPISHGQGQPCCTEFYIYVPSSIHISVRLLCLNHPTGRLFQNFIPFILTNVVVLFSPF